MASPPKNNPTTTTDDGSSCVICFEHIELQSKAIIKNCAHAFCFTCIKSWMDTTITCPLCKQTIDVLQHSFTSEESFQEEKVEAPNLRHDSSGGGQSNVEDQLQCLDHSFFIGEVQRLLNDAERRHRQLWQEAQSHRGLAMWEQQQLGTVEGVVAELRNHKRKLQALLQFDPHATLHDLYRLQDLLQASWRGLPTVTYARSRSPVRYGADDADAAADLSDEDDYSEDFAYMSVAKGGKKGTQQRQAKSKTRTPASKIGNSRNRKGIAN